jgi:chemotaxis-related protein WspD
MIDRIIPAENEPIDAVDPTRLTVIDDCWNRIGVQGDKSCEKLVAAVHCRNCSVFESAGSALFDRPLTDELIDDWTKRVATPDSAEGGDSVSTLVFRIGDELLAFDVRTMTEVCEWRPFHSVPGSHSRLVLGLVNVRGRLLLLATLARLLEIDDREFERGENDLDDPKRKARRMLVVADGPHEWVFPVEAVEGVIRRPKSAISDPPSTIRNSLAAFGSGVFSYRDSKVGLLESGRVFEALKRSMSSEPR